ncbi:MAG TPA: ABC transporter substrate-binding protein [Pyrinomonadaceae bacterium]|jgi:ABC-type branched-subunit amino acid transport system substrate-binding protein|nr:ABC transporter substrate-binding protein [Pyrinomonadaceae bacterium]
MQRHFTRQHFNLQLRALVAFSFIALVGCLYLSLPRAGSGVASAQTNAASGSQAQAASGVGALTPEEKRGKQIYLRGTSASGREITAYLGEASLEVPGSAITCAGCHGADGQGKPEGGVTPSNLTWAALTKPSGVVHASGRKHPPYTERTLELALTRGLDPAGNRLLNVMPRYQMTREDMNDLIAYIKRLGTDRDPGVTETSIRIGMLVPAKGALAEMGQAIKSIIAAYFEEVNSQGGIYNRKIELKFAETGDTAAATSANVSRLINDEQIFALSGAMIAGADREVATLAQNSEVPLVGPFTLYPPVTASVNRQVFYLLSGIEDQARALVLFAAQKFADNKTTPARAAIVYQESELNAGVASGIEEEIKKAGWSAPVHVKYARGKFNAGTIAQELSARGVNAVFLVGGSEDLRAFLLAAEKSNWTPALYLPGALSGKDILDVPRAFNGKLFLSFPSVPSDIKPAALENLRSLAAKYKLPQGHLAAQISAYVSAQLLVEGLKRAGRDLSREKLITALEGLYEYDTGLTPPLTYGPNRRVGAAGAHIVTVDTEKKQFVPASGWIGIK